MSIQSELTRLRANVLSAVTSQAAILSAIADKGVTVPPGATLHDVPGLIGEIPGRVPEPEDSVKIGDRWYHYVQIGTQLWIAENLDYKFTVNGSQITIGTSSSGQPTTPTAWYYDDDETTYGIDGTYRCGLLYNWHAVKYLNDNKSTLLPEGWHVPSTTEWDALATAVGGTSTAGTKLKAKDNTVTSNWPSGWGGTDDYGFNALPAGCWYSDAFTNLGSRAYFLTTTEFSSEDAYGFHFNTGASMHLRNDKKTDCAFSVRLVKDVP